MIRFDEEGNDDDKNDNASNNNNSNNNNNNCFKKVMTTTTRTRSAISKAAKYNDDNDGFMAATINFPELYNSPNFTMVVAIVLFKKKKPSSRLAIYYLLGLGGILGLGGLRKGFIAA